MNINQAKEYIFAVARKNQVGYIPIDKLNLYFRQAQIEKLESLRRQFEITKIVSDELAPLLMSKTGQLSSNQFTKPSDFMYTINLETQLYKNPTSCDTDDGYNTWDEVKLVQHSRKNYYLTSSIVAPTQRFPIAINYPTSYEVYPGQGLSYKLTYVRVPKDPKWNGTGTPPQYDTATSQDWELPESTHNELCAIVLKYLGIATRDGELYQGASTEQQRGEQV